MAPSFSALLLLLHCPRPRRRSASDPPAELPSARRSDPPRRIPCGMGRGQTFDSVRGDSVWQGLAAHAAAAAGIGCVSRHWGARCCSCRACLVACCDSLLSVLRLRLCGVAAVWLRLIRGIYSTSRLQTGRDAAMTRKPCNSSRSRSFASAVLPNPRAPASLPSLSPKLVPASLRALLLACCLHLCVVLATNPLD